MPIGSAFAVPESAAAKSVTESTRHGSFPPVNQQERADVIPSRDHSFVRSLMRGGYAAALAPVQRRELR